MAKPTNKYFLGKCVVEYCLHSSYHRAQKALEDFSYERDYHFDRIRRSFSNCNRTQTGQFGQVTRVVKKNAPNIVAVVVVVSQM